MVDYINWVENSIDHNDIGHEEAERIILKEKFERLFNFQAPSNREKKYLRFVEETDKIKLDAEGIYSDRYRKAGLIKTIFGYSKLTVGKDPLSGKVLKYDIFDCETERVGKVFQGFYKKGVELGEKYNH